MEIPMKRFGGKNKEIELSSNCEAKVIQVRKSHCPSSPSTCLQSPSVKWFDLVPLKKGKRGLSKKLGKKIFIKMLFIYNWENTG